MKILHFLRREPLSYAYCSDTKYFKRLASFVKGVSLLYHEATFDKSKEDLQKLLVTQQLLMLQRLHWMLDVELLLLAISQPGTKIFRLLLMRQEHYSLKLIRPWMVRLMRWGILLVFYKRLSIFDTVIIPFRIKI
jgi:hypothetical protein